jgi:transcriptional regulator with XRE-family HTH domain
MSEDAGRYRADGGAGGEEGWAAETAGRRVRALRRHFGDTQAAFADRLGTNQQTVSEWERGARRPRRMAQRLLHLVAEQAAFYRTAAGEVDREAGAAGERPPAEDAAADASEHGP